MTERRIQFVDGKGQIYTAFFGETENGEKMEPLWNIRLHNFGADVVRPAHDDEDYNDLEFFETERELVDWLSETGLTRLEDLA